MVEVNTEYKQHLYLPKLVHIILR